jgi:hypothetical protein
MKIVSLLPSATEIVYAFRARESSRWSGAEPAVRRWSLGRGDADSFARPSKGMAMHVGPPP